MISVKPCLSWLVWPLTSLVEYVRLSACWCSLYSFCVGIGRQARYMWGSLGWKSTGFEDFPGAYMKRFISSPSSHCGRCKLILCAITLYPPMYRCVAHTKVMEILILTYLHVLKSGCCHLVVRRMAILFRGPTASTPSIPSTEAKNGKKCQHFWRNASR